MFVHAVMFKFADPAQAAVVAAKLKDLPRSIKQLKKLDCLIDELGTERSYHLLLLTYFESDADYRAYDSHPDHVEVKTYIGEVSVASVAVDGWESA